MTVPSARVWFLHHFQVALASITRLVQNPFSSMMTIAVIGIALSMPAGLYVLLDNLQRLGDSWKGSTSLSVFLQHAVTNPAARELADRIGAWPEIADVELITPEEALDEFRRFSGFGSALDDLAENPLPAVLLIQPLAENDNPSGAETLQNKLEALPETELVQIDLQWVKRFHAILDMARRGILLVGVLLALAVLLIVGNTIRLEIQSRREEILVTRLIGATDGFVRKPFLYSGLWYGVTGALIGWLLVVLVLWLLAGPVSNLALLYGSSYQLQTAPLDLLLVLLAFGSILGLLGAWLAVSRHLAQIEPE